MSLFTYLFHPHPAQSVYTSPIQMALLMVSILLILGSFGVRYWRRSMGNPITKKLSRSWSTALLSFGLVGILFVVSRVEGIQILGMRFLWVLWLVAAGVYVFFQYRIFTAKHYHVLPKVKVADARDRYLPGKRRR